MAKLNDVNAETVNLPAEQQAEAGADTVRPAVDASANTLDLPKSVRADLTIETPPVTLEEANELAAKASSAGGLTIDVYGPKQTVQRGEAAPEPEAAVGGPTHHLDGLHKRQNDERWATQARPQSAKDDVNIEVGAAKRGKTPGTMPSVPGYEVLSELGRGGMGIVFKARQTKLNRIVALKMVLAGAHASAEQLARFYTEAEAVASLHHANIVQIYEVGEFEGLPFFSIEYVDGGMLADRIAGKPRPPREAAETLALLASAMTAAHGCGIVHRDLKPGNVLLTRDGLPKITDFGLAKRLEGNSSHTKSGTLMGSPSYMSPEQARGDTHEVGTLSDLYSLGAILYELLTGRPPFVGPTVLETLLLVRHQEPVAPTRLQPKCPRDLETICLKCLHKEPSRRYANCQAMADDVQHFLAGEPIQARPVGWVEQGWRWCRRNPRVAILSASVAALLLAVIVTLGFMSVRMNREREALAKTREIAGQRLEQATRTISGGNYQQAQDILQWSDPLLSHDELSDARIRLEALAAQVDVYAEFHKLLDSARFACRFGSKKQKELGRDYCHQLLALYDEIEGRSKRGAAGLPPLSEEQQHLFKEDAFEALLTAALVERELAVGENEANKRKAATQAISWLNRAEKLLPNTRALYVQRAPCWGELGDAKADAADIEKAKIIPPTSAVDRFWRGFAEHMRGDKALAEKDTIGAADFYHKEIAEYAAFLQQRPEHFWGYFNWANAHVQLGDRNDLHDAIIGFTACIRLRPDFPWPYNNRGIAHLRLGQNELAVLDFGAALKRNPSYLEAYGNRALAHRALKKLDLAVEDYTKAIALSPESAESLSARAELYLELKQDALAAKDYTQLLVLAQNKSPILEKRAELHKKLNKNKEAILDYGELIKLNPKNLKAVLSRAQLHLADESYAAARDDFTAILEKAPSAAEIVRARAILNWQNLRDFDAALTDFKRFAQLAPNVAEPHRCIGAILLGQRQYPAALDALETALRLRPGYSEAIWIKAQIAIRKNQGDEALKELDELVAKLPDGLTETLVVRAGVYCALDKLNEAAADYQHMIKLDPKEPEAYVSLARIYEKQGQLDKAAACLDQLVSAAPESKWAFARRAEFRRDCGLFDQAEADCDKAASLAPTWQIPALIRASVTAARGKSSEAVAEAERILDKTPTDQGQVLFAAACVWSLAAAAAKDPTESNRYAETAADYLTKALDKGFHDFSYPEHNRMAEEPALARIREIPRVRELLQGKGSLTRRN